MTTGADAKVIDHEFAFFGPLGFDLGLFLAGYTFPFAVALASSDGYKMDALGSAMSACVKCYFELLSPKLVTTDSPSDEFQTTVASVWTDTLRFMGCELLRRVLGVAKRAELEQLGTDASMKPTKIAAERIVLNIGELLLLSASAPMVHGST